VQRFESGKLQHLPCTALVSHDQLECYTDTRYQDITTGSKMYQHQLQYHFVLFVHDQPADLPFYMILKAKELVLSVLILLLLLLLLLLLPLVWVGLLPLPLLRLLRLLLVDVYSRSCDNSLFLCFCACLTSALALASSADVAPASTKT
jgi:hypothetical protein